VIQREPFLAEALGKREAEREREREREREIENV
jgi:hypothetical protein